MKIMACVDGGLVAEQAYLRAVDMLGADDELYVVHAVERRMSALKGGAIVAAHMAVVPTIGDDKAIQVYNDHLEEHGKKVLEHYVADAKRRELKHCHPVVLSTLKVKEGLVEFVEKHDIDYVCIGTHNKGAIARAFQGSVSNWLAHHAHCSVLLVKEHGKKLVV